jgi:hypothetical protein
MYVGPANTYNLNRVNDIFGTQPLQAQEGVQPDNDADDAARRADAANTTADQTRTLENQAGLGNRIDIFA